MRRVLFVNGFIYLPGEGGYKRTMYLFNIIKKMGYEATLLTSDFNHYAKQSRDIALFRKEYPEWNDIQFVHLPPYTRNISFKRWFCQKEYTKNSVNWISEHIDNYDVVYMHMPDAETIIKVSPLLQKKGKPLIVDVRDLFPESLKVKLRNPLLYNLVTFKAQRDADKAYACADELVAVSKDYLNRGLKSNKKSQNPEVVYIGSILDMFDAGIEEIAPSIQKKKGEFWLTYAGTIGSSYDLKTAIDAIKIIQKEHRKVKLIVLGQGPEKESLERYAKEINADVAFVGFVDYKRMAAYLSKSDITLNAIKVGASQSIINKVADYYAASLPMLNSCWCEEQIWLNKHFNCGLNYRPENVDDLVEKFMVLYNNKALREEMGRNSRKLAEERFDRANSYKTLINVINTVTKR